MMTGGACAESSGLVFWLAVVRTCFVSDLQRGFKIQDAKFNLEGTAEVSELGSAAA